MQADLATIRRPFSFPSIVVSLTHRAGKRGDVCLLGGGRSVRGRACGRGRRWFEVSDWPGFSGAGRCSSHA